MEKEFPAAAAAAADGGGGLLLAAASASVIFAHKIFFDFSNHFSSCDP
jgi:hypothetical protein